jgi:hypothetical protein
VTLDGEVWARRELTPEQQRSRRYELGRWRSEHADKLGCISARTCMAPAAAGITAHVSTTGSVHVRGVMRCGAVGSCPVCAPVVRARRAADIDAAVEAWRALGNEVWFVTMTVPHGRRDPLGQVLDGLRSMWREAWQGSQGQKLKKAIGLDGFVRAFEVTYGKSGWHPHIHALLFTRGREFSPQRVINRWRSRFVAAGLGERWQAGVSVDVRKVTDANVGAYLGKVRQEWGAGVELARADLKRGKGLTPQQLLELASTGEARWVTLWREWESFTKGLRWIEWSRGLRDRAASWQLDLTAMGVELRCDPLSVDEVSDEEAASADDAREVAASWHVPAEVWSSFRRAGKIGVLLTALVANDGERYGCFCVVPWRDPGWRPGALDSPPPRAYGERLPALV